MEAYVSVQGIGFTAAGEIGSEPSGVCAFVGRRSCACADSRDQACDPLATEPLNPKP